MSTPTPRTNHAWNVNGDDNAEAAWSLAQKLERELTIERSTLAGVIEIKRGVEAELAAERAKTADCGLTIASLCDGILGEDFADRSDQMLIRVGCRMKAELAAEREKVRVLRSALQDLCDEQNGAPLDRRREQWQEAMDKAVAALALSPYT